MRRVGVYHGRPIETTAQRVFQRASVRRLPQDQQTEKYSWGQLPLQYALVLVPRVHG